MNFQPIPRRTFLRASGIALGLPFLESMNRAIAAPGAVAGSSPRRIVCIGVPFGFDPPMFIPTTTGRDYKLPSHLERLSDFRDDFTIISGLSHPNTGGGGHKAEAVLLTGAAYPDYSHNLKNTISIDQEFAAHVRGQTRYGSFVLSTYNGTLSYTSNGVAIPSVNRPSEIFRKLFLSSTQQQAEESLQKIDEGRSLLDVVGDQARRLGRRISKTDKARVDEYFDSVRDVELQLQMEREWVHRPRPEPVGSMPQDIADNAYQQKKLDLMFDMIHLALVTDSTRVATIKTFGMHHDLSHHGKEPGKLSDCRRTEVELIEAYGRFLGKLKATREGGRALLDETSVMMTSNLRDGNTHWTYNLPVLLAGGGFRHGQHLSFNNGYVQSVASEIAAAASPEAPKPKFEKVIPQMGSDQQPLCNLYTSMLQQAGVETDRFGSGSGTLTGLDVAAS